MEGHASALVLALIGMVAIWLAISTGTVLGRVAFERRERVARERSAPTGKLARSRMLRHASSHRTEGRKWRRISALRTLVHAGEPRARLLLRRALADDDQDVVGAAVRLLGELGDDWAVGELIETLQNGSYARSRVATQLDALLPKIGRKLVRLLRDDEPAVRFWAATLLGRCPGMASARLVALTSDPDANVRAAAVEAIGEQGNWKALAAAEARLEDDVWFVRVHACRSVGLAGSPRLRQLRRLFVTRGGGSGPRPRTRCARSGPRSPAFSFPTSTTKTTSRGTVRQRCSRTSASSTRSPDTVSKGSCWSGSSWQVGQVCERLLCGVR